MFKQAMVTFIERVRPGILISVIILGAIGIIALFLDVIEAVTACITGIAAISRDLIDVEKSLIESKLEDKQDAQ